jgi:diguanylate cyclase (GGDEF)-like protein
MQCETARRWRLPGRRGACRVLAAGLLAGLAACGAARAQAHGAPPTLESQLLEFENGDYLSAWEFERRLSALQAAIPKGDTADLRRFDRAYCWFHKVAADFDNKDRYAEQKIAEAEAAHDEVAVADLWLCRGYFRELFGDNTKAMADYNTAVDRARHAASPKLIADSLSWRGDLRANLGDVESAMPDLLEAQRLYTSLGLDFLINQNLGAIANAYSLVGDMPMSLKYLDAQLKAFQSAHYAYGVLRAKSQIGAAYAQMGRNEESLATFREVLALRNQMNEGGTSAPWWLGIARALANLGRYRESLEALAQARKQVPRDNSADFVELNLVEGEVLSMLGRDAEALDRFAAAERALAASRNLRSEVRLHEERSRTLEAMGRHAEAYFELRKFIDGHRELDALDQKQAVTRMRVAFDQGRTETSNAQLSSLAEARAAQVKALKASQRWQWLSLALAILVAGSLLTFSIREWRRSRRLRVLAMTDELTRLANRRRIMLAAAEALVLARQQGQPLTILIFDIDHFKLVNDTYGHDRGDLVLKRVADASKRSLRKADRIGRIGGEEFMVVLSQTDRRQAELVGTRIQAELAGESWSDVDAALRVTVSIGIALAAPTDTDVADVIRKADLALYQAKNNGRNRIEFHEEAA